MLFWSSQRSSSSNKPDDDIEVLSILNNKLFFFWRSILSKAESQFPWSVIVKPSKGERTTILQEDAIILRQILFCMCGQLTLCMRGRGVHWCQALRQMLFFFFVYKRRNRHHKKEILKQYRRIQCNAMRAAAESYISGHSAGTTEPEGRPECDLWYGLFHFSTGFYGVLRAFRWSLKTLHKLTSFWL